MYPRFSSADSGHVWLLIRGYINQLSGQTLTDLRVGTPMPTTNFVGVHVTLTETQRNASVNLPYQSRLAWGATATFSFARNYGKVLRLSDMGYFIVFLTPRRLVAESETTGRYPCNF
jgi:hypothetical protein